jgi:predicted Zn-dependent peptidase
LVLGFATDRYSSLNKYALKLLNVYLGCGMGSLLFQKIREERGLAYSVYSALNLHADTGVLLIYAGTSPSQVKRCLNSINDLIVSVAKDGIRKPLLDETKKQLKGLLLLSAENPDERMISLGNSELYTQKSIELKKEIYFIESVKVKDINSVAETVLTKDYALVSVGPEKYKRSN